MNGKNRRGSKKKGGGTAQYTCEICGTVKKSYPSQIKRFCSQRCAGKHTSEQRRLRGYYKKKTPIQQTRIEAGVCVACGLVKPTWPHTRCDSCLAKHRNGAKAWREKHQSAGRCGRCGRAAKSKICSKCVRETSENHMKKTFGIDSKQYQAMVAAQSNLCAICEGPPCHPDTRLSVDHDHQTGRVGKLLCRDCNSGLGFFQDDPCLLARASEYLSECRG